MGRMVPIGSSSTTGGKNKIRGVGYISKYIQLRFGDCKSVNPGGHLDLDCHHDYDFQYCCKDVVGMQNSWISILIFFFLTFLFSYLLLSYF